MNKQTCTCPKNLKACSGQQLHYKDCSQETEQDWEKEFDSLCEEWAMFINPREKEYQKMIKQFIHSRDKEVREQERKRIVEELRLGRYGKKLGYTTYEVNTNDILKPEE